MEHRLSLPRCVRHAAARLLVAALSVSTFGPALHAQHDTDCAPLVILHDEHQHHVQAAADWPGPGQDADHCVACHFARSSRGPVSWEVTGLLGLESFRCVAAGEERFHPRLAAAPRPARAPPVA